MNSCASMCFLNDRKVCFLQSFLLELHNALFSTIKIDIDFVNVDDAQRLSSHMKNIN